MDKYSKWEPNKVHILRDRPVIYNKLDKPIHQWDAEQQFKKAVSAMHTWAVRAFRLAVADPDADMREYHLEHFEWELSYSRWPRVQRSRRRPTPRAEWQPGGKPMRRNIGITS